MSLTIENKNGLRKLLLILRLSVPEMRSSVLIQIMYKILGRRVSSSDLLQFGVIPFEWKSITLADKFAMLGKIE